MQMSATGAWTDLMSGTGSNFPSPSPAIIFSPAAGPESGFTLLELLVVLLIISILLSFITLNYSDRNDPAKVESTRLAMLLNLAQDEAILTGRDFVLDFADDGYQFRVLRANDSQAVDLAGDDMYRARHFADEIDVDLLIEGEEDFRLRDSDPEESRLASRLYLLSSGEMTPFTMTLVNRDLESSYVIRNPSGGSVEVSAR